MEAADNGSEVSIREDGRCHKREVTMASGQTLCPSIWLSKATTMARGFTEIARDSVLSVTNRYVRCRSNH